MFKMLVQQKFLITISGRGQGLAGQSATSRHQKQRETGDRRAQSNVIHTQKYNVVVEGWLNDARVLAIIEPETNLSQAVQMIELMVDRVQVSLMSQHRLVVLRDVDEERYLPIWIGQFESEAITFELQGIERERPLTHDLLKSTIEEMGGRVNYVYINKLRREVYFALINITLPDREIDIDARPSDAIALAVRLNAKIFVDSEIMDYAGIVPERNVEAEILGLPDDMYEPSEYAEQVDESKLSAFADFVDTLNLEDLEDD